MLAHLEEASRAITGARDLSVAARDQPFVATFRRKKGGTTAKAEA